MTKAVFNSDGIPLGFYSEEIHGNNIPEDAVEITDEQWIDLLNGCGGRAWKNGEVVDAVGVSQEITVEDYESSIQRLIDATAREKNFRDGVTLASYVYSTNQDWASEAKSFVSWRDKVWEYAYSELAKFRSGDREQPTVDEFLLELEPIEWPESTVDPETV